METIKESVELRIKEMETAVATLKISTQAEFD